MAPAPVLMPPGQHLHAGPPRPPLICGARLGRTDWRGAAVLSSVGHRALRCGPTCLWTGTLPLGGVLGACPGPGAPTASSPGRRVSSLPGRPGPGWHRAPVTVPAGGSTPHDGHRVGKGGPSGAMLLQLRAPHAEGTLRCGVTAVLQGRGLRGRHTSGPQWRNAGTEGRHARAGAQGAGRAEARDHSAVAPGPGTHGPSEAPCPLPTGDS